MIVQTIFETSGRQISLKRHRLLWPKSNLVIKNGGLREGQGIKSANGIRPVSDIVSMRHLNEVAHSQSLHKKGVHGFWADRRIGQIRALGLRKLGVVTSGHICFF